MRDIVVLLFDDGADLNSPKIFQNWGALKVHPRFNQIYEYVRNDDGFNRQEFDVLSKSFAVNQLPTVLFTTIIQENPFKIRPITRIEGVFSENDLETIFNKIVSEEIPIPQEGSQGTKVNGEGEEVAKVDGDGGKGLGLIDLDLNFSTIFWGVLAIWSGKKTLDSNTKTGQIGYGGLSAYSASKAFNLK